MNAPATPWLVLVHHIPARPAYLRNKINRRLASVGAIPVKNAVYLLPFSPERQEDFMWILHEIEAGGGAGVVLAAAFVAGLADAQVMTMFRDARAPQYQEMGAQASRLCERMVSLADDPEVDLSEMQQEFVKLQESFMALQRIDYFGAPGRSEADALIRKAEYALRERRQPHIARSAPGRAALIGKRWVTRPGVHIDRIATIWLVRRFIDAEAQVAFHAEPIPRARDNDLRFDSVDAEISHQDGKCTFETLLTLADLRAPALATLAEIIHDIDLKDAQYGRRETDGVALFFAGLAMTPLSDAEKVAQGSVFLDTIYRQLDTPTNGDAP